VQAFKAKALSGFRHNKIARRTEITPRCGSRETIIPVDTGIRARLRGSSEAFEAGGGVERLQIFNPYGIELVPRSRKNRDLSC